MAMLLEFSMYPLGKGESVGEQVAGSLQIIDRSGVPYRLNSMGTVLEGEWEEVVGVVKQCLDEMSRTCDRVSCVMKMDWRRGAAGRLDSKVESVEKRVGRPLRR